jgi:hypothetical protein
LVRIICKSLYQWLRRDAKSPIQEEDEINSH